MSTPRQAKTEAGERTRRRIIAATRELIGEADLQSLKLDNVAGRIGVAKSSILWYFGSKNGLLLAVVEDIFEDLQAWVLAVEPAEASGEAYLRLTLERLAAGFERHPEANALLIAFIVNKTIDPAILARIRELYAGYREVIRRLLAAQGALRDERQVTALLAFIDGAFLQWYLEPATVDLKQLLLSLLDSGGLTASIREEPLCPAESPPAEVGSDRRTA